MLHTHAALSLIPMLHVYACPCCVSIHVNAACLCCIFMLRIHASCLCCMYMLCSCCMTMLYLYVRAVCSCYMFLLYVFEFLMFILHVYCACLCCMFMLHVLVLLLSLSLKGISKCTLILWIWWIGVVKCKTGIHRKSFFTVVLKWGKGIRCMAYDGKKNEKKIYL